MELSVKIWDDDDRSLRISPTLDGDDGIAGLVMHPAVCADLLAKLTELQRGELQLVSGAGTNFVTDSVCSSMASCVNSSGKASLISQPGRRLK